MCKTRLLARVRNINANKAIGSRLGCRRVSKYQTDKRVKRKDDDRKSKEKVTHVFSHIRSLVIFNWWFVMGHRHLGVYLRHCVAVKENDMRRRDPPRDRGKD
jgi:hypothetical protein